MIKLTTENTTKAIERCRKLKPQVRFLAERTFSVKSSNNTNSYTVRFDVKDGERFGLCECKASERGLVCYHIIAGATANIYRQSLKRQMV
jgi:GR25 family glycosyltransferase involved in LPS biosynthesis